MRLYSTFRIPHIKLRLCTGHYDVLNFEVGLLRVDAAANQGASYICGEIPSSCTQKHLNCSRYIAHFNHRFDLTTTSKSETSSCSAHSACGLSCVRYVLHRGPCAAAPADRLEDELYCLVLSELLWEETPSMQQTDLSMLCVSCFLHSTSAVSPKRQAKFRNRNRTIIAGIASKTL